MSVIVVLLLAIGAPLATNAAAASPIHGTRDTSAFANVKDGADATMLIAQAVRIANLAGRHRLPSVGFLEYARAGGLLAFGVSFPDLWRRAAGLVDKILRGARPADLPVERATKFELLINLKTARALGLTIPPSLLLRADQVIDE